MKRRQFLLTAPALLIGCAGAQIIPDDLDPATKKFMINSAGFGVGIMVAKLPREIDLALRNIYMLATQGKVDTESINKLIDSLIDADDLVMRAFANRIITAAELIGATIVNGRISSIESVDKELLEALAQGYVDGYDLAKAQQRRS